MSTRVATAESGCLRRADDSARLETAPDDGGADVRHRQELRTVLGEEDRGRPGSSSTPP